MKSSSERGDRRETTESFPHTISSSSSDDKSSVTRVYEAMDDDGDIISKESEDVVDGLR